MPRTAIDCNGFLMIDDIGLLPDPPYVAGDHYTTCRGCDHCAELEDRYFADQDARKRLGDDE